LFLAKITTYRQYLYPLESFFAANGLQNGFVSVKITEAFGRKGPEIL
jgi:hypothetical protein